MTRRIPTAFEPAPFAQREALAIRALDAGNASEAQQNIALHWIMRLAAGVDEVSYRPGADGDRETAFAEGRRFVGIQIRHILAMTGEELERLNRARS